MADLRSGLESVDYRFINDKPDPGFSPERNKAIIEETIRDTDKFLKNLNEIRDEATKERLDVLSSFALHNFNKSSKSLEKYLGRKKYEELVGEKLLSRLRVASPINRMNGTNHIKKGFI